MQNAEPLTQQDRQTLILDHLEMAKRMARKFARRVPRSFGRDEIESAAVLGLTEAATRFDAQRGEPFIAYAAKRVRGAVLDELRRRDVLTRRCRQKARRMADAVRAVEAQEGREATADDVAETLGMSTEEVLDTQLRVQAPTMVPLDDVRDVSNLATIAPVDEQVDFKRRAAALREVLPLLPKRELMVLSMYYQDGLTQKEIGTLLGVSESRVCQLRARALRSLRSSMSC
jgi:RNA polymerase sigma factor for flagellar operon FliA